MVNMNKTVWLIYISLVLLLNGCVIAPPPMPDDPYYSPVVAPSPRIERANEGSLYHTGLGVSLYVDRKAHRIGDVITIVLNEKTVSSKSSSTKVTKDSSLKFNEASDGNTLLGSNPTFKNLSFLTDLQQGREFDGGADADQSNRLQGNITAMVADILPNGNLVIRGEKWMKLNQGDEYIRVSGILRPEDITPDNTASSTKLANARISYSGTGSLADSQSMGWLSRVFNSVFWPF